MGLEPLGQQVGGRLVAGGGNRRENRPGGAGSGLIGDERQRSDRSGLAVAALGVGAICEALRSVLTRRPANIERPTITVHRTTTTDSPIPGAVGNGVDTPPAARPPRSPRTNTNSPVRISRIGSDHLQVFIRPAHGCSELLALVERLEQLIGAGYDTIDVVFEPATRDQSATRNEPVRPRDAVATRNDSGTSTDAKLSPLARA